MTMVPFTRKQAAEVVSWLNNPGQAIPLPQPTEGAPGRGFTTPKVPAVRIACTAEGQWLDWRRKSIGASEIAIIMGVSSWASPYALWYRKKLDWRLPRTEGQRWGHLVEDPIAELFAEDRPDLFVAMPLGAPWSLWRHPTLRWVTCTPDRLAVHRDGTVHPVEIKSDEGGKGWGKPGTDEVPEAHRMQLLWQEYVFGADGGWLVRKRGSGRGRVDVYWVPFDPGLMNGMITAGHDFLESIGRDEPPDVDGSKATTETLKDINPAVDSEVEAEVPGLLYLGWVQARAAKRDAVAREALVSNTLRAAMGRAEYAVSNGVVFAKRRIGKRQGYEVPPGTTDELREVGSGQRDQGGGVHQDGVGVRPAPGEGVPGSEASHSQEGSDGGDSEAGKVAGRVDDAAAGVDPQGVAVTVGTDEMTIHPDDLLAEQINRATDKADAVDDAHARVSDEFMTDNAEAMRRLADS